MAEKRSRLAGIYTPSDKKRIALLNGAVGQANRIHISGQVVDIPITEEQKDEDWDYFHGLPISLMQDIRPLQDFNMGVVRRPRLQLEILNANPRDFKGSQIDETAVLYSSEEFTANDNSFFTHEVAPVLEPGSYVVRVILRGIDSLRQSVSDLSYIRNSDSSILKTDVPIGYGKIRVLPEDYDGLVLTSDIDQTFLDTPLHSSQGLFEVLFQTPAARAPIPGMPALYKLLQASNLDPSTGGPIPTIFISASPHFFRRTLSAVFGHHDLDISGLHLKYLVSTFDNILSKVTDTIWNINDMIAQGLTQTMERSLKFLGSSLASLFDQVAYKLGTLLENRLMQPTGAREVLMGDNTEGDYFIFVLYQYLLMGEITGKDLENYLYKLNFQDREALTRDASRRIVKLVERNLELHGKVNPVEAVWIHRSNDDPDQLRIYELILESLPEKMRDGFRDSDQIKRPVTCRTGVGFALAAYDRGLLDEAAVREIIKKSLHEPYQEIPQDETQIKKIIEDFQFTQAAPLESGALLATGEG